MDISEFRDIHICLIIERDLIKFLIQIRNLDKQDFGIWFYAVIANKKHGALNDITFESILLQSKYLFLNKTLKNVNMLLYLSFFL